LRYFKTIAGALLLFSFEIYSSQYSYLDNTLSNNIEEPLLVAYSYGKFDKSLDILNYANKLTSTKPKEAVIDNYFVSYKFKSSLKLGIERNDSSGEVERLTYPKSLKTHVITDAYHVSYTIIESFDRFYDFGIFYSKDKQDPLTIDCYEFGSTIFGGSCDNAELRLLNSEIYKTSGELVYLPVLSTSGESNSYGIILRSSPKVLDSFNLSHTLSIKKSKISQSYESTILETTDSFIRQIRIDGSTAGDLLDSFRDELPQSTPWNETEIRYSLSSLYSFNNKLALSGMYSFVKVNRSNYLSNPSKEDFTQNNIFDITLFYNLHKNLIIYSRISASTNYLLGESPLAYNRKSNHLFDHPYGQVYVGTLIKF